MKKECEYFSDKLMDYAVGELAPEFLARVQEHAGMCTDCWKKVDEYKKAASVAADAMRVDFTDEVWEMQRREIIKKATYRVNVLAEIGKFIVKAISARKLAAGVALLILLAAGTGAGYMYFKNEQQKQMEKTITNKIDMFDNMALIERLDFYEKMSESGAEL